MPLLDTHDLPLPAGEFPAGALGDAAPRRSLAQAIGVQAQALAVPAIGVLFLLLHLAWFVGTPGDLDSFNFALGVRRFDVAAHQPHPPGAPVYIAAGKIATRLWRSAALPVDSLAGPEAAALAALSLVSGALSIVVIWRIVRRIDDRPERARYVTLVVGSAPLLWMLAARPVSDAPGLLLVLCAYLLMARGQLTIASLLSGIAVGVRVQTALLTVPVLLMLLARRRSPRTAAAACGGFAAGTVLWALPLLAVTGPGAYWAAVTEQSRHDWSNPMMLAAAPAARHAAEAVVNALVRPWGHPALAFVILGAAVMGIHRLLRTSTRRAAELAICAGPYLLFHLTFQETATIRYALPTILAVGYLAGVAVDGVPRRWRGAVITLLVGASLLVSVRSLRGYALEGAPGMRLLGAMHRRAITDPPAFVTGHANLRRIHEILPSAPPWKAVWSAAPYEWQGLVDYWRRGESAPVWFVADARRTDLTLIDPRSQRVLGAHALNVQAAWILRGMRPRAVKWLELRPPAWIAVKGFSLTPEVNAVSARDGEGPALNGAVALVRRTPAGAVLAVAGRHVGGPDDPPVRIAIQVDGRAVSHVFANARERHYRALVHLRPDQLKGAGPYATVTIRSTPAVPRAGVIPVTVEHFDYQPEGGVLFTFGGGWQEPELRRSTGLTWRWTSRRATLLVHRPAGTRFAFELSGDTPASRRTGPSFVRVTSGNQVLDGFGGTPAFSRRVIVPGGAADSCDVEVAVESSSWFVPADAGESADRRELALRTFNVATNPVSQPK